jgi:hypothetical protein
MLRITDVNGDPAVAFFVFGEALRQTYPSRVPPGRVTQLAAGEGGDVEGCKYHKSEAIISLLQLLKISSLQVPPSFTGTCELDSSGVIDVHGTCALLRSQLIKLEAGGELLEDPTDAPRYALDSMPELYRASS